MVQQKIAKSKREAEDLLKQGWSIKHSTSQGQGYSGGKTCCLVVYFFH